MRNRLTTSLPLALAFGLAVGACSDSTSPNDDVRGTYDAVVLRLTSGVETTDLLAAGAALSIELKTDGTTTGALVIPAEYTESGDEETVSLAGTYTYDQAEGTVTFDMAGDTFVRDITWEVVDNQLQGAFTGVDFMLTAVLQLAPGISQG